MTWWRRRTLITMNLLMIICDNNDNMMYIVASNYNGYIDKISFSLAFVTLCMWLVSVHNVVDS